MAMARRIRFVTLDATGTLLRPHERIGATYVDHWHRIASASSSPSRPLVASRRDALECAVDAMFLVAFRTHAREFPNFGRAVLSTDTAEPWWSRVILSSLPAELLDALPLAAQRHELSSTLYAYYARGDAWCVFDDVAETLEVLHAMRIRMAVISDFDERLPRLLDELGLAPFVETVTTSWDVGEPKPSSAMFHHAFAAFGELVDPSEVLHIGDHVKRDYYGARAVGAHARLLVRGHGKEQHEMDGVPRADMLTTLKDVLPLVQ